MSIEFKKFSSIENHYQPKTLEYYRSRGYADSNVRWIAQEKAHGANLSFHTTDNIVWRAAKRSQILGENVSFYNWQKILERNLEAFKKAYILYAPENCVQFSFYGEVIGGSYPDVPNVKGAKKVQSGIYYHPDNVYYIFDIRVLLEDGSYKWLSPVRVENLHSLGLQSAKILHQGTLNEALRWKNDFNSTIPSMYGLPTLAENIVEGIVLKPLEDLKMPSGSRVILKSKNEKWSEKTKSEKVKKDKSLSESQQLAWNCLAPYLNENRLHAVISKIGEINRSHTGQVIKEFSNDALKDFRKDESDVFEAISKDDMKVCKKLMAKIASKLLTDYFVSS